MQRSGEKYILVMQRSADDISSSGNAVQRRSIRSIAHRRSIRSSCLKLKFLKKYLFKSIGIAASVEEYHDLRFLFLTKQRTPTKCVTTQRGRTPPSDRDRQLRVRYEALVHVSDGNLLSEERSQGSNAPLGRFKML